MGRWSLSAVILLVLGILAGCGSSSRPPGTPLVASIRLTPNVGSVEIGSTLQFSAATLGSNGQPITAPVTFQSSNPAVLTVANNGLACAGSWDSLTSPVVCSPGGVGQTVVTASSSGTVSAPVTIYVHQHISRIVVCPLAPAACTPPPPGSCLSAAQDSSLNPTYEALAFSGTDDITSTVGPFNWSAISSQVVTLTPTSVNGVVNGQVVAAPKVPGKTQIFASIANTNSAPLDFTTCAVQSISLAVRSTGGTTLTGNTGTAASVDATVIDTLGNTITTAPLTWSSSQPSLVTVSNTGSVTGSAAGGASITASCIEPTCNIGFTPMQAVYATVPVTATFTSTSTTPTAVTAYVSSTGCGTTANCSTAIRPLTGNPPALGVAGTLGATPNSLVLNPAGTTLFLGNPTTAMQVNAASTPLAPQNMPNVSGKVLTVSPDGKKAVFAAANEVFIVDTSSNTPTNLLISGATVATFSPDNLKAYILAGSNLYVYSTQAPLHTISLAPQGMTAIDAAFFGTGGFVYIGGTAAGGGQIMVRNTCDDSISLDPSGAPQQIIPTPGPPLFLRPLPGTSLVALDPPNLDIVTGTVAAAPGRPVANDVGCPLPFPSGYLGITNTLTSVNLGQGAFNPVGFQVSTDGKKAYVAIQNVGTIFQYDFAAGTISPIALVGNPSPLTMGLSGNGATLLVSGNDNIVHVIDTVSQTDVHQVPVLSTDLCLISTGGPPPNCLPDLLVVK
jgi:hypothetical protein